MTHAIACKFDTEAATTGWAHDVVSLRRPAKAERTGRTAAADAPRAAQKFNRHVHGARGLLALFVFIFHVGCCGVPGLPFEARALPHAGLITLQFGVEIFFCISGFIVAGALGRAHSPCHFLTERAIRILPVLWATLAVVIPLGLLTHQHQFAGLAAGDLAWIIPLNLAALAGAVPVPVLHLAAWSLSYELLFYGVAATLWWLPARRVGLRALAGGVAAGLVIWHPRALFFAIGYLVSRTDITRHPVLRIATRAPGLMLVAFMACWYQVQFGSGLQGEGTVLDWVRDGRLGLAAIAISFAILAFSGIVAGSGLLGRALRSAPFQWLGSVSYSFYLWHLIVMALVKRGLPLSGVCTLTGAYSQLLLLAIALPASLAVAQLSMRVLEKGAADALRNFKHAMRAGRPLPVAALPAG
jgi:peptidoglycan/LPS O-acetylase OafA/YrhL